MLGQRAQRRRRHGDLDPLAGLAAEILRHDREGAALANDDRRVIQQFCDPRAVERRRHDEKAQILAQYGRGVEAEREGEIGVERALVEFVENHQRDAGKAGIVQNHAGEDALGHDFEARFRRHKRLRANPEADALPDALAEA